MRLLFAVACSFAATANVAAAHSQVVTPDANAPTVKLTKSAPATITGNQITFTINYANSGTSPIGNAVLTDAIPAGSTFVSASNGGTFAGGVVTWNFSLLAPQASIAVMLTVGVTTDGTYTNQAHLAFNDGGTEMSVPSNKTSTVRQLLDTTITSKPTNPSTDRSPTFTFTSTVAGATFRCSLDGVAAVSCASPLALTALAYGAHSLAVASVDGTTGEVDPTPATYDWTIVSNPKANADSATTLENMAVTIDVLANDTGVDDLPLTLTATLPAHGTATANANHTVTYVPTAGYVGSDSFSYTVTDADGKSSTATVTVMVTMVSAPPDLLPPFDLATPPDLTSLMDLAAPPDSTSFVDASAPPDLAVPTDLSGDLLAVNDLAHGDDFATSVTKGHSGGGCSCHTTGAGSATGESLGDLLLAVCLVGWALRRARRASNCLRT